MLYLINDTKISITGHEAIPVSSGGTASYIAGFVNYLTNSKTDHFGLIGNFYDPQNTLKCKYRKYIGSATNYGFFQKLFCYFLTGFRPDKNDVLYFQRPDHLPLSVFNRAKRVLHLHGQPWLTMKKGRSLIVRLTYLLLERLAMHLADLIIVTDARSLKACTGRYPFVADKIHTIPAGLDFHFFSEPGGALRSDDHRKKSKTIVYVGRLSHPKRISDMLIGFSILSKSHPDCKFIIAGDGTDLNSLKRLVTELNLNERVEFKGFIGRNQIRELLYDADVSLLLSGNEGSPIAVKESLACGVPVVVNDVGDLSDYVINGYNGYVVSAGDHHEISNRIEKLLLLGGTLRHNCVSSVMKFDEHKIYSRVCSLLEKIQVSEYSAN